MAINLYSKDSVDDLLDAKLSITSLSNAATSTLNAGVPTAGQALTYDGTDLIWATVSGSYLPLVGGTVTGPIIVDESAGSGFISTLSGAQLSFDGTGCYISGEETTTYGLSISNCPAINFADSTSQTTAGVSSDKALANAIAASIWYTYDTGSDWNRSTGITNLKILAGDTSSCGVNDGTDFITGFPAVLTSSHYNQDWKVSVNGVLSDFPIMNQIV
jgi:hypothetical protein